MSSNTPENWYNDLSDFNKKSNIYSASGLAVFLIAIVSLYYLQDFFKTGKDFSNDDIIALGIFIICIPVGIIIARKYYGVQLNKRELMFFRFYKAAKMLQIFLGRKTNEDKNNARKATMDINYMIYKWYTTDAPDSISTVPRSIASNINQKVIPLIRQGNTEKLSEFLRHIQSQTDIIFQREPTLEDWKAFNEKLDSFAVLEEQTVEKERGQKRKQRFKDAGWIALFLGIGVVAGFIVRFIGGSTDVQITIGGAFAATLIGGYVFKRK